MACVMGQSGTLPHQKEGSLAEAGMSSRNDTPHTLSLRSDQSAGTPVVVHLQVI